MRRLVTVSLFVAVGVLPPVGGALAQDDPDPGQPRPPVLLEMTREERIATAVRLYLHQFIQAIQQADTVALASLVPPEAIPADERRVAERAGCPSLGQAVAMLRSARGGQAENPALPLGVMRLGEPTIELATRGSQGAVADARIEEQKGRRLFYAPVSFSFELEGDAILLRGADGGVVGLCGFALGH